MENVLVKITGKKMVEIDATIKRTLFKCENPAELVKCEQLSSLRIKHRRCKYRALNLVQNRSMSLCSNYPPNQISIMILRNIKAI